MVLKCADIGHLAAAPQTHKRWALLLEEEFYRQVYVVPYRAMLCHALPFYAVPCYAELCCAMLCRAMTCYAVLCYAVPGYVLCYAMLCHAMPCHAVLCHAMLCYAVLRYAMLCHASCSGSWGSASHIKTRANVRLRRCARYIQVVTRQRIHTGNPCLIKNH